MSGNWRIIAAVAVSSAVLGAVVTIIARDADDNRPNATSFSRKTDGLQPPKPQWASTPAANAGAATNGRADSGSPVRRAALPKPTLENPPQVAQIRDEVTQNPHVTPQTLLAFAEQVASSMEGAFASKETRFEVSRQLIACARDGQSKGSARAARALCLSNLERLKERFPEELTASYQSLLAELPEDLIFVSGINGPVREK
jgi:cell division protein FtsN